MAEVSIASVVGNLEGDLVRERDKGLEDLRTLLSSSRNGGKLNALGDDGFHKIFESIYRMVRTDKASYLKALQAARTPTAARRLASAATALRLTVEAGCQQLGFKTVTSVLDHIVTTLPTPDDTFIEPLRSDYLKCFRVLLEYPAHGEHLRPKHWQNYVDFLLAGIAISIDDDDDSEIASTPARDPLKISRNGLSFRPSQASTQKSSRAALRHDLDDLLAALRCLSAVTNAPLMTRASAISDVVVDCLTKVSRAQELAVETFNNLTFVLLSENLGLLKNKLLSLLPVYRRCWVTRSSTALREQILISLFSCRSLLLANDSGLAVLDLDIKHQLLSTLFTEYIGRYVREMLQFDDVVLPATAVARLGRPGYRFAPLRDSSSGMANWTLLEVMASLVTSLSSMRQTQDLDEDDQPRKRRRVLTPVQEMLEQAVGIGGVERVAALQVLFFLPLEVLLSLEELGPTFEALLPLVLEEDATICTWAMLLLTKLIWSTQTCALISHGAWRQLWEAARRALTSSAKSRASCLLIDAIVQHGEQDTSLDIAAFQEPFISSSKDGPASITDAALIMFAGALRSSVFEQDAIYETAVISMLEWLKLHWTLPPSVDRVRNSHLASHVQPQYLYNVLATILNAESSPICLEHLGEPSVLVQARAISGDTEPFISYLEAKEVLDESDDCLLRSLAPRAMNSRLISRLQFNVAEMLSSKMLNFKQAWHGYAAGRSANISSDLLSIATSACVVAQLIQPLVAPGSSPMTESIDQLWGSIQDALQDRSPEIGSRLILVASKVLSLKDRHPSTRFAFAQTLAPFTTVLNRLVKKKLGKNGEEDDFDIDPMESMDSRTSHSQRSFPSRDNRETPHGRRDLSWNVTCSMSLAALHLELLIQVALSRSTDAMDLSAMASIVSELTDLHGHDLVTARDAVHDFLAMEPNLSRSDAAILLETIASHCLQEYDLERNEVALCFLAKVMSRLALLWTSANDEDKLTDHAFDIYKWYITKALEKGVASPKLMLSIASMLDMVPQLPLSFADASLPSPRTSLLGLLKSGPNLLKFQLSPLLVRLFNRYVLTEHVAIFNDILSSLPSDLDNLEGVAVRFYILAVLASKWHTVLRQATYHLFETAANVPKLKELGRICSTRISTALGLSSPRKLFKLFAPQIFYTWLGVGPLSQLPFSVFYYDSLQQLVSDNEPEITAQIALRGGSWSEEFASILGISWKDALQKHFAHAEAYCLASQTSLPESEQIHPNSETMLRKLLGTDLHTQKLSGELTRIVAVLIRILQDDSGIERAFEKSGLKRQLVDHNQMSQLASSSISLPVGQQPFFRAKYLIEELQWLCAQTNHTIDELQSSSALVYLYRSLLLAANPALGSLQACSIIRKIKIAVSLGGTSAASGYPLEMLLHNLRPYLTSFHCSEDAIAIYWYLLEKGKAYLSSRPSFLVGLAISVFASLSTFVASSQDNTTQENHFIATMSKAQQFVAWLGQYLATIKLAQQNLEISRRFLNIISHAKEMTGNGSNAASLREGRVLLCLLEDRLSPPHLLNNSHFDMALHSLCSDFVISSDPGDDILASADDCVKYSDVLRRALKRVDVNDQFRIWAAQVIGRACSLHGPDADTALSSSQSVSDFGNDLSEIASYAAIIKSLEKALWHNEVHIAASAEQTLQSISSRLHSTEKANLLGALQGPQFMEELCFDSLPCPDSPFRPRGRVQVPSLEAWEHVEDLQLWSSNLVVALCLQARSDPVLEDLRAFASTAHSAAPDLVPFVTHVILAKTLGGSPGVREKLSDIFSSVLSNVEPAKLAIIPTVLKTIFYLRRCRLRTESTLADRNLWLEVDYGDAAEAAARCQLWHAALLCIEIQQAHRHLQATRASRRSTQSAAITLPECLAQVYQSVEDLDYFYAGHHDVDIRSVIQRLSHESASHKMLSFQSAVLDSLMRSKQRPGDWREASLTTASALSAANMQSISRAVASFGSANYHHVQGGEVGQEGADSRVWRIGEHRDSRGQESLSAMKYLQSLASTSDPKVVVAAIDQGLLCGATQVIAAKGQRANAAKYLIPLAVLSESRDLLTMGKAQGFESILDQMSKANGWAQRLEYVLPYARLTGIDFCSFEVLSVLLDCRENVFGMIRRNNQLRTSLGLTEPKAIIHEAKIICQSLAIAEHHDSSQFQLSRAAYLSELAKTGAGAGVDIEAVSQFYLAKTIWEHGETSASVDILRKLESSGKSKSKDMSVSVSEILSELGQQVSSARLEPPDEIIEKYLVPAFKELKGQSVGANAGRVFHLFATFCDTQLQDPINRDDYTRAVQKHETKLAEVQDLERQLKKAEGNARHSIKIYLSRAKSWLKIYEDEWQQKYAIREALILQCLENYLQSMTACDTYSNDKLRFLAIWLDELGNPKANDVVNKYVKSVPSWKFATVVNQLVSRLADNKEPFQQILDDLLFRISNDHPYHSLYQLFAASKSKNNDGDEVAASRYRAAIKLTELIHHKGHARDVWVAVHNCSINFVKVAQAKLPNKSSKVALRNLAYGDKLISTVEGSSRKIPPPAMKVEIRLDKNYTTLPVMVEIQSQVSIAGGVSAPKITTAVASDGSLHKMLLKAGNDDLRQDSIMEQVFEQVSTLLSDHRATRQRKLGIRTYNVVPLITNAGIIEFVQGTVPLHDYVLPAHERYFPKDYKSKRCRNEIGDAQSKPLQQRVQAYRNVTANFHPVMRFFFMEKFLDPDEWFYKRLNYSRSSAAISILGHVLGLGDRHGHNILLDQNTGEVVHIDLGVAFEAGRILPVPEVVPFRLTRDLVDAMGISGVEGVFRRCCNFTLEALRQDQESIMTLLDVLRYDPLVSWSISPYRLKKMQEMADASEADGIDGTIGGAARDSDEANEANRALAVVREKLGKSLSVEAEVNELIRQATDEKNLAVLYSGWGAYA